MKTVSTRRKATKFNVIVFRNYDGTTTLKVVTREQYKRLTGEKQQRVENRNDQIRKNKRIIRGSALCLIPYSSSDPTNTRTSVGIQPTIPRITATIIRPKHGNVISTVDSKTI